MTKEIYNLLIEWESVLYNAYKINFVHLNNIEFKELKEIYEKYTNKTVTKSQINCNSCRVKIVKKLATDYFSYKNKELEKATKKKKTNTNSNPDNINN